MIRVTDDVVRVGPKGGISVSSGRLTGHGTGGAWSSAALALDFTNGRYRFDGADYASEAAVLAAAGGVKTGSTYALGPYEIGATTVTNGDFAANVTSWNAQNSGLIAWSSGQLQLTGNGGNTAGVSQSQTVAVNRAYRLSAKVTRVTGGSAPYLAMSSAAGLGGAFVQSLLAATDVPTQMAVLWGAIQTTVNVGIKMNSAAAAGTNLLDDIALKEVAPVKGEAGLSFPFECTFTMPAAGAGNKVLLAGDDDSERNTVKLLVNSSGELRLATTINSAAQANILLGSPAAGSSNKVTASLQSANNFVQLNADAVIQNNNTHPSPAILRIGRDFTGNAVDAGAVTKLELFSGQRVPASWIWFEGDSYARESADTTALWKSAQAAGRRGFATSIGGTTLTNQRDRILANPGFAINPMVWWDGNANGYGTLAADRAKYAAGIAGRSDNRFIIIPPVTSPSSASDVNAAAVALQPALAADFPNNVFNAQAVIDGIADAYQADGIHLKGTTMDAVWAALVADPVYARVA